MTGNNRKTAKRFATRRMKRLCFRLWKRKIFRLLLYSNPPKAEEVLAIASGGEKMPQKSTYFYPKLPSGLIVNKIDADERIEAPAPQ